MPHPTRRAVLAGASASLLVPAAVKAQQATVYEVSIVNFAYDPPRIEIKAGDSIEWTNRDRAPHTATDLGGAWDTGRLRRNKAGKISFSTPGEYNYYCAIHPNMRATVVVT